MTRGRFGPLVGVIQVSEKKTRFLVIYLQHKMYQRTSCFLQVASMIPGPSQGPPFVPPHISQSLTTFLAHPPNYYVTIIPVQDDLIEPLPFTDLRSQQC